MLSECFMKEIHASFMMDMSFLTNAAGTRRIYGGVFLTAALQGFISLKMP
jgi:hypothetical protein